MDQFFLETLGFSENIFSFVILPSLIFFARIAEVSVNTIRIIYMLGGRRITATVLGFFEAFIWLIAIRQIFQHLDNWASYLTYPGGFAAGILVGMIIEEKIAYGKVIVRIITPDEVLPLIQFLSDRKFRYTRVEAEGHRGRETLVFTVLKREKLDELIDKLKVILPKAFYTVEAVRIANDEGALFVSRNEFKLFTWLRGKIDNLR
jgi:uncharacterized protein YebE (UPF0316 family)